MTQVLAAPLVLTKLRVPAPRPRLIHRARLVERLTTETGACLILVCAPAGYGKTTLFAEWTQALRIDGIAVAWYALDPSDDDPLPFGAYLVASLVQALGPMPELVRVAQQLRSSPELDLQGILPALLNALAACDQECVLILDDYHLISAPAIHSAVAFLLEHLPENAHIAIGSRADPPLPLARLRARGKLTEIRAPGLRFSAEEALRFLNEVMRLDLSPEQVAALETRTEGWAAGLQLAALAMQAPLSQAGAADKAARLRAFTGGQRYLVDYLLEEVFNRLPEEVKAFLLATSILERMCAPLCRAVLEPVAPRQDLLKRLEQSNLFVVALDDSDTWYRYHHLFRDFLQARLKTSQPERLPALHRAACAWLAENGFLREAARHAFQTQDWEYAAAFVERHTFTMIIHSEMATIYEWCAAFPEAVMRAHPMLCILQCWPLVFRFRRENRARVEERLRMAEQAISGLRDARLVMELNEHAGVVRSFLAMAPDPGADARAQLALARSGLSSYPSGDPGQFSGQLTAGYASLALQDALAAEEDFETARQIALRAGLYFGVVESSFQLARLRHAQGRLRQSAQICRQGQADIAAMFAEAMSAGAITAGAALAETNPEASAAASPPPPLAEQALPALGCLDVALGCVLLEQNALEEAEQHLLQGLERIGQRINPYYLLTAAVALFRLREAQRRPAEALAFLDFLDEAWPDIDFCTGGLRVEHALRFAPQGSAAYASALVNAAEWLQTFSPALDTPPPGMGPFGAAEAYYLAGLAWCRAQIAIGSPDAADRCIQWQLAQATTHGLTNRVIELSLLEAEAAQALGQPRRTWAALERGLLLAQPEGYLRIFDQGPALARLLGEAAQRGLAPAYLERILAASAATATAVPTAAPAVPTVAPAVEGLAEPLSARELEVLRLMAQGATNQAIAGRLVITVGTVKSHINHILGKLGARNRTEAVARGQAYHLI